MEGKAKWLVFISNFAQKYPITLCLRVLHCHLPLNSFWDPIRGVITNANNHKVNNFFYRHVLTRLTKQHACYFLKINFWTVCFQHILKEMLGQFVSSFHCTFDALILQENIQSVEVLYSQGSSTRFSLVAPEGLQFKSQRFLVHLFEYSILSVTRI